MFVFEIQEPNSGLRTVIESLKSNGIRSDSRNGPVVRFPRPVCLSYVNPQRRLLTSAVRDANPFFHLVETMWMFGGLCELRPLLTYNAGMAQYSDDGSNLRGTAYGHRWRNYSWGDQLLKAADVLRSNPEDRRVVVTMWDPNELGKSGKDFACNLQVLFSSRPPTPETPRYTLDMTVTNRSNDLIYGAMGSNLFHFSMLLEYMALHANMEVGVYYQVANNLHLYTENPTSARCWESHESIVSDVQTAGQKDDSLTRIGLTLDPDPIARYIRDRDSTVTEPYLSGVVAPLVEAYHIFKLKTRTGINTDLDTRVRLAQQIASACQSDPLRAACQDWLERRRKSKRVAGADPQAGKTNGVSAREDGTYVINSGTLEPQDWSPETQPGNAEVES